MTLRVPPGALPTPQTLTISESTAPAPSNYRALTTVYHFEPDGLVFQKPVEVTIATHGADVRGAAVVWTGQGGAGWDALPTTFADATARADVLHFSEGFVGTALDSEATDGGGLEPDDGGSSPLDGGPLDASPVVDASVEDGAPADSGAIDAGPATCVTGAQAALRCLHTETADYAKAIARDRAGRTYTVSAWSKNRLRGPSYQVAVDQFDDACTRTWRQTMVTSEGPRALSLTYGLPQLVADGAGLHVYGTIYGQGSIGGFDLSLAPGYSNSFLLEMGLDGTVSKFRTEAFGSATEDRAGFFALQGAHTVWTSLQQAQLPNVGLNATWITRQGTAFTEWEPCTVNSQTAPCPAIGGLAMSAAGDYAVTGSLYGSLDFGGGTVTSTAHARALLLKYDAAGTYQTSVLFGSEASASALGLARLDASGNLFVLGTGPIDFGNGVVASGQFLAKLDQNNQALWARPYPGTVTGLDLDASGEVYLTGNFTGTVDFGCGDTTSGPSDAPFVAKYRSTDGSLVFERTLPASAPLVIASGVDATGAAYFTGTVTAAGLTNYAGAALPGSAGWTYAVFEP